MQNGSKWPAKTICATSTAVIIVITQELVDLPQNLYRVLSYDHRTSTVFMFRCALKGERGSVRKQKSDEIGKLYSGPAEPNA